MTNMFKSNSRFAALVEPAFNEAEKSEIISKAEKKETNTADNKPRNNNFLSNEIRPVSNERPPVSNESRPVYNDSNLFSQKVIDKAQQQRKDDNHQRLMNETAKILSIDNFPELQLSNNKVVKPCSFAEKLKQKENPLQTTTETNDKSLEKPFISFSEKLKQVDIVIETKVNEIPYGWAVIKRDPITKKQITEYNKEYENDLKRAENLEKKQWPCPYMFITV